MTRFVPGVMMCALWMACGEDPAPTAPGAEPAVSARVDAARVARLPVEDWIQGEAEVRGTQFVVFWEPWCPHCRDELPHLEQVHRALGPEGLEVVGLTRLTRGASRAQAVDLLEEHGVSYAVGVSDGSLAQRLEVRGVPSAVVLVDGEVVWRGHPRKLSEDQLRGWLHEPRAAAVQTR